jgi:hypothetical protein
LMCARAFFDGFLCLRWCSSSPKHTSSGFIQTMWNAKRLQIRVRCFFNTVNCEEVFLFKNINKILCSSGSKHAERILLSI